MKAPSCGSTIRRLVFSVVLVGAPWLAAIALGQELTKVPFPYGPLGLNSLPWVVAKEARFFEKNRLDVDMVYVGASAVIVQSMLSGSANIAGFGGPAVVTNVLRGGDIIQVAAMAPYFTQSLIVRSELSNLRGLPGKKIGITRFGSVTDFALRTILERHNLKDVTTLQMGGFPKRSPGCHAAPSTALSSRRRIVFAWCGKAFASWFRQKTCDLSAAVF